jgi:TPP-dependent pyruvate/acetoin dehydrogenase alpha subunit
MDDEDVGRIEERVDNTIAEAVQYAEESEEPALDTLYDHVYA